MKTIVSIIFILFIGIAVQAQDKGKDVKVETIELINAPKITKEFNAKDYNQTARLYRSKNSKIKRELNFITKANKAKMV
ncbi:hypothetical protein Q2T41_15580 [Maribacter confluentis]|uniref:GLPGLI family protein n=1 Tax=Maribacter confluentis TaxID=1656093 RepID=A0ABT8RUJ3_9FLAO|nr:hypothetical protein [Maribacter confluentis]MDO1514082.1 hypothetical protein [Maribacter confluentis]